MTQHIDKYGRTWNWTPGHDTNLMLQIDPRIMLAAYNFSHIMRTQDPEFNGAYGEAWPVPNPDCYLLKHSAGWYAGIRLSDEGHDYLSPGFDDHLIAMMVEGHRLGNLCRAELSVVWDLVTAPGVRVAARGLR